jgi:RNA polymerase sigma-70 factor (ECF subfamily)
MRTVTMTLPRSRSTTDVADGVLVARVAAGDGSALEALYDRYGPPAFCLARQVTGEPGCAGEVVRDVFLDLWQHPDRYDPGHGGSPSWLLAATHHRAVDAVRAAAGRPEGPPLTALAGRPPAGGRVHRALDALPAEQRQVLVLAYYAGRTHREIAEHTGVPVDTVRARLLTGMRQVRQALDAGAGRDPGATP